MPNRMTWIIARERSEQVARRGGQLDLRLASTPTLNAAPASTSATRQPISPLPIAMLRASTRMLARSQ